MGREGGGVARRGGVKPTRQAVYIHDEPTQLLLGLVGREYVNK
jgi:hypothetical protein